MCLYFAGGKQIPPQFITRLLEVKVPRHWTLSTWNMKVAVYYKNVWDISQASLFSWPIRQFNLLVFVPGNFSRQTIVVIRGQNTGDWTFSWWLLFLINGYGRFTKDVAINMTINARDVVGINIFLNTIVETKVTDVDAIDDAVRDEKISIDHHNICSSHASNISTRSTGSFSDVSPWPTRSETPN